MSELKFELNLLSDCSVRKMIADVNNVLANRRSELNYDEVDRAWDVIGQQLICEMNRRIYGEAEVDE